MSGSIILHRGPPEPRSPAGPSLAPGRQAAGSRLEQPGCFKLPALPRAYQVLPGADARCRGECLAYAWPSRPARVSPAAREVLFPIMGPSSECPSEAKQWGIRTGAEDASPSSQGRRNTEPRMQGTACTASLRAALRSGPMRAGVPVRGRGRLARARDTSQGRSYAPSRPGCGLSSWPSAGHAAARWP